VLCDLSALGTLPMRQLRSGLAEVIKCGIIRDEALFGRLEKKLGLLLKRNPAALAETVARCCEIKAEVVAQDERDGGVRAILNFGHTIGHAIEAISGYGKFLHGEAIAIGQVAAAKLSVEVLGLPAGDAQRIEALFRRTGLPISIPLSAKQEARLFEAMRLDKKVSGGEVQFVLAPRLGKAEHGAKAPAELIAKVLRQAGRNPG
jgi:3-dehydroquinate synthase